MNKVEIAKNRIAGACRTLVRTEAKLRAVTAEAERLRDICIEARNAKGAAMTELFEALKEEDEKDEAVAAAMARGSE